MFKVTTLIENNSFDAHLHKEKGLSLLIDNGTDKIVFDYGISNNYWENATKLGFNPSIFNLGVISHGHRDHAGGTKMMLEKNMFHTIYANEKIFSRKFVTRNGETEDIGMPQILEDIKSRFIFIDDVTEICKDVYTITNLDKGREEDKYTLDKDIVDSFDDETVLVLKGDDGLHVITGCCHKGLKVTLERVKQVFPTERIITVVGGLHIQDADYDFLRETVKAIEDHHVKTLIIGHCTGGNGLSYLDEHTSCNINLLYTGSIYILA